MAFTPLLNPLAHKMPNQFIRSVKTGSQNTVFKDALPISSWLALGGVLNGILILALGRIALLIPLVFLLAKLGDALLIAFGLKANKWMKNVIHGKISAQLPNDDGSFGPRPANKSITLLFLGARSNHPMGLLAPGFREIGKWMAGMQKDIDKRAEEYGLLGSSEWLGAERSSGNEIMYVMYFKDVEGLHRYAHDPLHREAWNGWNKMFHKTPYISIWHETFTSSAGSWETIYANTHPTLLGAAQVPIKSENDTTWSGTLVDASRGNLKTSRGRMDRTDGTENEKYGLDAYELKPAVPQQVVA